ncbi:MAG: acyl-CoA dehydrogenase [Polyangiaceae bacterium]|nr:acyl-CoA dehydrogenase [Polyangiaceae bacterium]
MELDHDLDLIRQNVGRFADEVIVPAREALNHHPDRPLPDRVLPGLLELGLLELDTRDAAGIAMLAAALEVLARAAAAPAALLFAHALGLEIVRESGCPNGAGRRLADGGRAPLVAYPAYAEPGVLDRAVRCRHASNALTLDGTARFVVNAPIADWIVLPVSDAESGGAALVLVEKGVPGVVVGDPLLTLGMRGCPTADVTFTGVRLPADALLAGPPRARELARAVARRFYGPAAAISAGILGRSLRTAADYAAERYQGGCSIIEHDEVRSLLAGMIEDHVLGRTAAERLSREALPEPEAAALFLRAKVRAAHATADGVQILGGNGYMEDYDQERCMRDAKQAQCLLGRVEPMRQEMVDGLALQGGART